MSGKRELVWDETGFGSFKILQDRAQFSYGVDAVLLGAFAAGFINGRCNAIGTGTAVDLGTGTGIIPLILAHKTHLTKVIGIDVEKYFVELATKSMKENRLEGRVSYKVADVSKGIGLFRNFLGRRADISSERVDFVTCNPPYFKADGSMASPNPLKDAARRETKGTLEDFCKFAGEILKPDGEFFLIHRPERLADVFCALRSTKLEPRDMRMVSSTMEGIPKLVLIHSVKDGGQNLRWLKPLAIYEKDGTYTRELLEMYEK